jgi:RNA polymerase sigma factor (sigma-70 family)
MGDRQGGGRGSSAAEELILRTVAAHADSLLRTARRYSICTDDAQDAYQRALEIFMTHADRLDPARAAGWLHVVVKREALAIRRSRKKLVGSADVDFDAHEARRLPTPEEQLLSFDMINRSAEALKRLKPQELRALWLKAQGHSYNDIGAITGWSYTKVNRCLTEGRRSFLARYAGIESGAECRRWMPVISAMADGEATPEQILELRPHLRNCPGCRATLKALHDSSAPLAAVLPIPLAVAATDGAEQISNLFMRAYEAIAGGLHERAVHSATKAQAAIEAAAAGKVAAVAASAAAVAGGGYATVERTVERSAKHEQRDRARRIGHHDVVSPRRKVAVRVVAPAAAVPAAPAPAPATPEPAAAPQPEFGASGVPVTSGATSGYAAGSRSSRDVSAASEAVGGGPAGQQPRPAAPKPTPALASEDAGSEFGP